MAEGLQPVGVLDGAEQGVVVDLLDMAARADVVAEDDRRYRVNRAARVLVEGDDQPAVVACRPPGVAVEVLLHPAVTGADGAVVHAVAHVRAHKRHGRQLAIVTRKGAERPVDAGRQVSEVNTQGAMPPLRLTVLRPRPVGVLVQPDGLQRVVGGDLPRQFRCRISQLSDDVVPASNTARFLIFTGMIVALATAVIIATKGQLGRRGVDAAR